MITTELPIEIGSFRAEDFPTGHWIGSAQVGPSNDVKGDGQDVPIKGPHDNGETRGGSNVHPLSCYCYVFRFGELENYKYHITVLLKYF